MKRLCISICILTLLLSCEEVVNVNLPTAQNLFVIEGFFTDSLQHQYIKVSRTNSFGAKVANPEIDNANVRVEEKNGTATTYTHEAAGRYRSSAPVRGIVSKEYRAVILLPDGTRLESDWQVMPPKTKIIDIKIESFEDNDPGNGEDITVYFPRITAKDSADLANYYRWIFYRDDNRVTKPEAITIQNDKFFDGNLIPNTFDAFSYKIGEQAKVELHAINRTYFTFLSQLKAQSKTVGTTSPTTPAIVKGNIKNVGSPSSLVLGFFATSAISIDSVLVTE